MLCLVMISNGIYYYRIICVVRILLVVTTGERARVILCVEEDGPRPRVRVLSTGEERGGSVCSAGNAAVVRRA